MDDSEKIQRSTNPRETANVFSLITFIYTKSLFTRGYKKDLEDDDLYEVIETCRSKKCADELESAYHADRKRKGKPSIFRVLWNCFGMSYLILGLFNLAWKLLTSALEPDAIANLVAYFNPGQTKMSMNDALYYATILIGLKLVHSFYHPNYMIYLVQLAIQIRTSFCSLIYRKALKLSPKALEKTSLGNIVTLITKDVAQFEGAIWLVNDLWIGAIQSVYICYLIYVRIGWSSTVGVIVLASAVPIQYCFSKIIKNLRLKMNTRTDKRLQETQEALSTIKIIKMYTWEKIFVDRIDETRRKEVEILLRKAITQFSLMISSDLLGKVGFYILVMMYIRFNTHAQAETIFYVMRSYGTLRHIISLIFTYGISLIAELSAAIERIDNVLQLDELPKHVDTHDENPQIDIKNISVEMKGKQILDNITLTLNAGLNVITGQLGCGKSSLIKTILEDLPVDSGEVHTRGTKSYASQDPWLFPASIKQNILFGEQYDYERYNKVIEVCALKYDFSILEKGDETIVADRGMNLSKGQQARINLARAIYKTSDIYLLDDSLTALDTKVQDHIFINCIEGFLKGKLVFLVTHNTKHITKADKLVILENGAVKYEGIKEKILPDMLNKLEELEGSDSSKNSKDDVEIQSESTENTKLVETATIKKQIYHEDKKKGGLAFEVYTKYVKYGGGIFFVILIIACYFGSTFFDSSSQVMLTNWVNHQSSISTLKEKYFGYSFESYDQLYDVYFASANSTTIAPLLVPNFIRSSNGTSTDEEFILNRTAMTQNQNETYHLLIKLENIETEATKTLNIYTMLLIASIVFEFMKSYFFFKFGTNASIGLHKAMLQSVVFGKMAFFDTFFVGNILNRFSQDLSVVDEHLPMILALLIGAAFAFGGIVGMMASVSWKFIVPSVAILMLLIILRHLYMPTARSLKRLEAATRSPMIGHLNSSMEGLTTVRAYKAQDILRDEFDRHQDLYISAKYTSLCVKNAFHFYMDITAVSFTVYTIVRFLFFETDTAAGDVGLALTQAGALTMVIQFGLLQWSEAENLMTSVERVMEYTKIEPENKTGTKIPDWPSTGKVQYQNVSLTYTNSNEKVLQDITFDVKPKEKIGIVGRTGAGKSSIIATLFRLYNHEGTILIDNVDTKILSLKYLRQHISIIPQDPITFSGSIRNNIDPFKEFSDEQIWNVIRKVYLDSKIPNLECLIEDTNFSSGERQLLSLARAIIRQNKIVVLDEATANMDPKTEELVQKAIDENFSDSTVFIISHRLNSITNCDKVLVVSTGKIIEFDTPDKLVKNKNSMLSKMLKVAENSNY
ncbi:ATP-binding cassette sub-family C member 4-like [Diorhabda sublineata]|uniref:ATP-binding cassette sub-family C member 4-like n=1 Tax=Diorhabda sublineata TaxID=1163346 RepID=UPI0024E15D36|nr:ATP-binding cassette sub-family C member 4-like [Diorhabda sublineata]